MTDDALRECTGRIVVALELLAYATASPDAFRREVLVPEANARSMAAAAAKDAVLAAQPPPAEEEPEALPREFGWLPGDLEPV